MNSNIVLTPDIRIPKKLERDLIKDSVVELRFSSELSSEQLYPKIFEIVSKDFPNYRESEIPSQLRATPQFGHISSTTLYNDSFSIGFSSRVIVFNCNGGYKGWPQFFDGIPFLATKALSCPFWLKCVTSLAAKI